MRTDADRQYRILIERLLSDDAEIIETRNHSVRRLSMPFLMIQFDSLPLITYRKVAVKKALREMEWFMSGDSKCPDELKDWWAGQLNEDGRYMYGYPDQLRYNRTSDFESFDQIKYILYGLRNNPNSRRLCLTTWNPGDMANITETNGNPNTPSCCHLSFVQFFVSKGELSMLSYQRSCDALLGLQHNWVQHFALLTYFAYHANLKVGKMRWEVGDLHLYNEESHLEVANIIADAPYESIGSKPILNYVPSNGEQFLAKDFSVSWGAPEPLTTIRPKLL